MVKYSCQSVTDPFWKRKRHKTNQSKDRFRTLRNSIPIAHRSTAFFVPKYSPQTTWNMEKMLLSYCLLPHLPQTPIHNTVGFFGGHPQIHGDSGQCAVLASLPLSITSLSPSTAPFRHGSSVNCRNSLSPTTEAPWHRTKILKAHSRHALCSQPPKCSGGVESPLTQEFGWEVSSCQKLAQVRN